MLLFVCSILFSYIYIYTYNIIFRVYIYVYIYMYSMYIGIQLRLSSVCFLFTIFELLSSIGKERRTFYSQVEELPLIVPGMQEENRIDLDCRYCFNSSLTKTFINTVVLSWILYCLNLSLPSIIKIVHIFIFLFIYFFYLLYSIFFCSSVLYATHPSGQVKI